MFIVTFKLNLKKIMMYCAIIICLICIFIVLAYSKNVYKSVISLCSNIQGTIIVEDNNFVDNLKKVHDNLNKYVGKTIVFEGYVYRKPDFEKDQFVTARLMIDCCEEDAQIVGFLCRYKEAANLKDNTWIRVKGKITKGYYNKEEYPIIDVTEVIPIPKPKNQYVKP